MYDFKRVKIGSGIALGNEYGTERELDIDKVQTITTDANLFKKQIKSVKENYNKE